MNDFTARHAVADVLLPPESGAAHYSGTLADQAAYIENEQLLDPALWALFVAQFRIGNVDDRDSGWRCEYWGKMMRGACFTFEYTQNEQLYAILDATVRDLLTTEDSAGRISTYSPDGEFCGWDMWGRKYVLLGLQYFLEICRDDSLGRQIIESMCRQADYICAHIGDGEGQLPITHTSKWWEGLNSSSIMEPFVRLYCLTGHRRYLDFAHYIIRSGGLRSFDIFEAALEGQRYPFEYPVTKAYEMMSCFEGIIEYYRVTGEQKYKTMAVNFARLVMASDITVIGSAGTTHELFDHSRVRQFDPAFDGIMQETCVTVTWMKLCWQLLRLTGDPCYADQIERSAYNALSGAINVNRNSCEGQVFSFDSYSPLLCNVRGRKVGGRKDVLRGRFYWGCCVAIGAAGTALSTLCANMRTSDGVAVNLYQPGDYTFDPGAGRVMLHTDTDYPTCGEVVIGIRADAPQTFALCLRIPGWSAVTHLRVNGDEVTVTPGSYARLERRWQDGDTVTLSLDMRTRVIYATELDPDASAAARDHFALERGPIMLARDAALGEDIRRPVTVLECGGFAELTPSHTSPFPARQEYRVRAAEGEFTVVDYASAGQSWSPELPMTVWIVGEGKRLPE